MTLLSSILVLIISQVSQARADEMPAVVRSALGRFVGDWDVDFMINGATLKTTAVVKWSDNKVSLILSLKGKDPVTGEDFSTTEIFGWDGAREVVVEHGFTSDGSSISATHPVNEDGEWTSPAHGWRLVEGKHIYEETVRYFKWKSDDELQIEIKNAVPAAERGQVVKCVFRRK
jgi:hypothetical protein